MPRVKYRKEDILKATYELMKQEGLKNISARKIAAKLKGSTAPIYANFETIEEVKEEVIKMAETYFKNYLAQPYSKTEREIMNASIGFIRFARDEKELFKAMFLDASEGFKALYDETIDLLLKKEIVLKSFKKLTFEQAAASLDRLWIYLFGYATLVYINPKSKEEETNEIIEKKLDDIATYFKEVNEFRTIVMDIEEKAKQKVMNEKN